MTAIASLIGRGVTGSRPANGIPGQLYFDTTLTQMLRDNGTTWDVVEGVAGAATTFAWLGKSAAYTITTSDSGILVDTSSAGVTITLPTAVGATQRYAIKKKTSDANVVTFNTTSSQTIDGLASGVITLTNQNQSIEVESDNANWYVVARSGLSYATNKLASNVTMTLANTAYDGPSVTLAAGAWDVTGKALFVAANATLALMTLKLWDGTTAYSSDEALSDSSSWRGSLVVGDIITLATSTTLKLTALCSQAGLSMLAAADTNGAGNNASWIKAKRIG